MRLCYQYSAVFFAMLFVVVAHGQKIETLRVKFRMLSVNGEITNLSLVGSREIQQVKIPELRRSEVYSYEGSEIMRFVRTDQVLEGEPLPEPVLRVRGISQYQNPLVLLFHKKSPGGVRYEAVLMSDDIDGFPGGMSRFVNITSYPLLLLFEQGGEPKRLGPGQIYSQAFETENQNVHIQIASYAEGEVHKGLDDRIFPKPIHRDLYFIFEEQDGQVGRVKMRRLREHRNAAIDLFRLGDY